MMKNSKSESALKPVSENRPTTISVHSSIDQDENRFTFAFVKSFSPRSREACKIVGARPSDITIRDRDYFVDANFPDEVIDMRFKYHDQRRRNYVKEGRVERQKMVESGWYAPGSPGSAIDTPKSSISKLKAGHVDDSSMLLKEQKRMQQMLARQRRELEKMVSYEVSMLELKSRQDAKIDARKRYEAHLKHMQERRKQQVQEKRVHADHLRHQRELEDERQHQLLSTAAFAKTQREAKREKRMERHRKREEQMRMKDQLRKQEEFEKKTQDLFNEHQAKLAAKMADLERRDRDRDMKLKASRSRKQQEQHGRSDKKAMRVRNAMRANEDIRQENLAALRRKMEEDEERTENFKKRVQEMNDNMHRKREASNDRRNQAKEEADAELRRKVKRILDKNRKAEAYKKEMEEQRLHQQMVLQEERNIRSGKVGFHRAHKAARGLQAKATRRKASTRRGSNPPHGTNQRGDHSGASPQHDRRSNAETRSSEDFPTSAPIGQLRKVDKVRTAASRWF
eukprot:70074_1